ncbi:MAG: ATP-binding protein [Planctomycetota bacterium]|nr:ATP-binding protein [Planctomycetota bacterium]
MFRHSRFFWRLFLSYFVLACAAAAGLGLFAADRLHATRFESIQRALYEESRLVYELIEEDLKAKRTGPMQQTLGRVAAAVGCRFTIVDNEGHVIADTEAEPATMDNHRLRPEIVQAAAQGEGASTRWSHTLREEVLCLAYRAQEPDGTIHFVRLAVPLAQVKKGLRVFDESLLLGVAAVILLSGAACFLLARRQATPIAELSSTARAIAAGDLSRRAFAGGSVEAAALGSAVNAMAEAIAEAKAESAKAREELLAILGSMTEGIIATDGQRRIVLVNPAAAALLDFSAAGIAGKALWEVVRDEQVLQEAEQVAASGQRRTLRCGPIRGRYVAVVISPLAHAGGAPGLLLVAHDTTEAVEYQELRKEFVANVSHELRTPLTFIKGFIETLRDGALSDPVKGPEYLATIEKHVTQLTNLVNDLLELSRLESRAGIPRRHSVKLDELVRKVVDLMQPAAQKKEQSLTVAVSPGLPASSGDPDYLERAIANLLDNAIKYTPRCGAINVSAKTNAASVVIEVTDNGIGIPAHDLPRIFERFYRVDKSRSREMGGTGLGLAIVKHIAQAHGGSVEISSEVGKGSTVRLSLPMG